MLTQQQTETSVDAFNEMVQLPENADKHFELIFGEIIEKMVSHPDSSTIASNIMIELGGYVKRNKLGRMTGADGGYIIGEHRFIPDVAFITHEKAQAKIIAGYRDALPDLAIEVISPTDTPHEIAKKTLAYQQAGVFLWVVYPEEKEIFVYSPGEGFPAILTIKDKLVGGDVLPDFEVPLTDIFGEETAEKTDNA